MRLCEKVTGGVKTLKREKGSDFIKRGRKPILTAEQKAINRKTAHKKYYENNREKCLLCSKKSQFKNYDAMMQKRREYYINNREKLLAYQKMQWAKKKEEKNENISSV